MTWQVFSAGFMYGFASGIALVSAGVALSSRRTRHRPLRPSKVTITVTVRLTCGCGYVSLVTMPYEPGTSEIAVTCDDCCETSWISVPADLFASDG